MNAPYAIVPIGVIILLLYFLSHTATRLGILPGRVHRRFWNVLLLLFFLGTAVIGLLLAIRVNYKLEWDLKDSLMTWHADLGIGLTLVAFFHFLWHWNYYAKLLKGFSSKDVSSGKIPVPDSSYPYGTVGRSAGIRYRNFTHLIVLGFTTLVMQIIVLREFMTVFYGNELIIGIVLAVWMALTGLGAGAGRLAGPPRGKPFSETAAMLVLSFMPFLILFLLYFLRNIVFRPGSMPGLPEIVLSALVLLAPFCLLSGFLFTRMSAGVSQQHKANLIGEAYAAESLGSIAGGILAGLILVVFLSTFRILSFLLAVNVVVLYLLPGEPAKRSSRIVIPVLVLVFIIGINLTGLDRICRSFMFPNQDILYMKDTPYGNLTVTESAGQMNFFENNTLLFATGDPVLAEEQVHYAMVQHPRPEEVLLISGGISGTLSEIARYGVSGIDYVEINPWIIRTGRKYTGELDRKNVHVIPEDARRYIATADKVYDVVIVNVPEPATAQLNRYYTVEFYRGLKRITDSSSVIGISLPSTVNYVSKEAADLNSVVWNTLSGSFRHLLFVPGTTRNYLLASQSPLSLDIPGMIRDKGIETVFVNEYYLDTLSLSMGSNMITERIDAQAGTNTDFRPLGYFHQMRLWMSRFGTQNKVLAFLAAAVLLLVIGRSGVPAYGMFAGGFAASSMEILIIFGFQVLYGYAYYFTGIIITCFMLGLVLGVMAIRKTVRSPGIGHFIVLQAGMGLYALLLPLVFMLVRNTETTNALLPVFVLVTIGAAVLTAALFTTAAGISRHTTTVISARIYSYDLAGSAAGALLVSAFLLPLLGMFACVLVIAAMNLLAAMISFSFRHRFA